MDTALSNGDFICDTRKNLVELTGYDELLQRVLIRLGVKKGSFVYDKNLGSRLYTLKASSGNLNEKALALVREALLDMPEVLVESVHTALTNGGENLALNVALSINNTQKDVVITI